MSKDRTIYEDVLTMFFLIRHDSRSGRCRKYSNLTLFFILHLVEDTGKFLHNIYYTHFLFTREMQLSYKYDFTDATWVTEDFFVATATRVYFILFFSEMWKEDTSTFYVKQNTHFNCSATWLSKRMRATCMSNSIIRFNTSLY